MRSARVALVGFADEENGRVEVEVHHITLVEDVELVPTRYDSLAEVVADSHDAVIVAEDADRGRVYRTILRSGQEGVPLSTIHEALQLICTTLGDNN